MYIIVGGLVKSKGVNIGYLLIDVDSKEAMLVRKERIVQTLKEKKIDIHNVKLQGDVVKGTYYAINSLPYVEADNMGKIVNNNIIGAYKRLINNEMVVACVRIISDKQVQVGFISEEQARVINKQGEKVLCEEIKEETPTKREVDILEAKAIDKKLEWDISEFKRYMELRGWEYKFMNNGGEYSIDEVSPECSILHLPKGTVYSNNLFRSKPKNLKLLVIDSRCKSIRSLWVNQKLYDASPTRKLTDEELDARVEVIEEAKDIDTIQIEEIYFQEELNRGEGINYYPGLCGIQCNKTNLPKGVIVEALYNQSSIQLSSHVIGPNISRLKNSFNNTIINNTGLIIEQKEIVDSFNSVRELKGIKLGKPVESLRNSFNNMDTLIDIDGTKLRNISLSLNKVRLERVILKEIKVLIRSLNSKDIKEIKLGDNARDIRLIGIGSKIKEINIPKGVEIVSYPIGSPDTRITYNTSILRTDLLQNYTGNIIESAVKFKSIIGDGVLRNFKEFGYLGEVEEIGDRVFEGGVYEIIDTADFPKVSELSIGTFEGGDIDTLVINRNIKKLSKDLLKLGNVRNIVVHKDLSIGSNSWKSKKMITVYVEDGGVAGVKLKSNEHMHVIHVKSLEDTVLKLRDGIGTIDDAQVAKYKFMLMDDKRYSSALNEPYIKNIDKIYKLGEEIRNNNQRIERIELDTKKFKEERLSNLGYFGATLEAKIKSIYNNKVSEVFGEKADTIPMEIANEFKAISNFITNITNLSEALYSENFYNLQISSMQLSVYYRDTEKQILGVTILINNQEVKATMHIIVILINDKVVYMANSELLPNVIGINEEYRFSGGVQKICKTNLTSVMGKDKDSIDINTKNNNRIEGLEVTEEILEEIENNFKYGIKIITTERGLDMYYRNGGIRCRLYALDLIKGDILELRVELDNKRALDKLSYLHIINRYSISEILNIEDKHLKMALNNIKPYDNEVAHLERIGLGEDLNKLKQDITNYDIEDNEELKELGSKLRENSEVTIGLIEELIELGLYSEVEVSDKKFERVKKEVVRQYDFGDKQLVEYKISNNIYEDEYVIKLSRSKKVRSKYYSSYSSLEDYINKLSEIGTYTPSTQESSHIVETEAIQNIERYGIIREFKEHKVWNLDGTVCVKTVSIAVDKLTGEAYLLHRLTFRKSNNGLTKYRKIYRFRGIREVNEFMQEIMVINKDTSELIKVFDGYERNVYGKVYNEILSGIPKGLSSLYISKDRFKLISKQPPMR